MIKYLIFVFIPLFLGGCYDEEKLSPSNNPEDLFSLPQGNHDYDQVIMDWFDKYGFTGIYIWEPKNVYWGNESWLEAIGDRGGIIAELGDEKYVGYLCEMFERLFLQNYSDNILKDVMPFRVFFCSSLWYYAIEDNLSHVQNKLWVYRGWDSMVVNGASNYITDSLTIEDQLNFSQELNACLMQEMIKKEFVRIPDEFYKISKYTKDEYNGIDLFEQGYVKQIEKALRANRETYKQGDLESYIDLLSYSMIYLKDGELDAQLDDENPSWSGIFKRPEATKVKQKYDILVKAFMDAGVKIERIQLPQKVEF